MARSAKLLIEDEPVKKGQLFAAPIVPVVLHREVQNEPTAIACCTREELLVSGDGKDTDFDLEKAFFDDADEVDSVEPEDEISSVGFRWSRKFSRKEPSFEEELEPAASISDLVTRTLDASDDESQKRRKPRPKKKKDVEAESVADATLDKIPEQVETVASDLLPASEEPSEAYQLGDFPIPSNANEPEQSIAAAQEMSEAYSVGVHGKDTTSDEESPIHAVAKVLNNPRSTTKEMVAVLQDDLVLSAKVMRSASSAALGAREVGNVEQAVLSLGLDGVRDALGIAEPALETAPDAQEDETETIPLQEASPAIGHALESDFFEGQDDDELSEPSLPATVVGDESTLRVAVLEADQTEPEAAVEAPAEAVSDHHESNQETTSVDDVNEASSVASASGEEAQDAAVALAEEPSDNPVSEAALAPGRTQPTESLPSIIVDPAIALPDGDMAAIDDMTGPNARASGPSTGEFPMAAIDSELPTREGAPVQDSDDGLLETREDAALLASPDDTQDESVAERETAILQPAEEAPYEGRDSGLAELPQLSLDDCTSRAKPVVARLPFAPLLVGTAETKAAADADPESKAAWMARIEHLVQEARMQDGPSAAPLWFEAGRIYEAELGNLRQAAAHYEQAHKADPTFLPVVHAARRLFAQLGKWQMVVILLDEELKHRDGARAPLLVEKGRILETRLERPDLAEAHYLEALREDAAHAPALDAVRRQLSSRGDWVGLAKVLDAAIHEAPDTEQKVDWLIELGRLHDARLGEEEEALSCFIRALDLAPERREVWQAQRRLYARQGKDKALAEVVGLLAEGTDAAAEAVQLFLERARLLSAKGEYDEAIRALEYARERSPGDLLVLMELARLYERNGASDKLIEILEVEIDNTNDPAERIALHAEVARLCVDLLQDQEKAIQHFQKCVDADPTYQPALSGLGKLYARQKRWEDLAGVFEIQIATAPDDAQRIPLLFKLAELRAGQLDDKDGAIVHLTEILDISPGYVPALKLVATYYMAAGRWGDLLRMYEAELTEVEDKDQSVFLLERIAQLAEQQLDDPERAIGAYQRMLERVPGYLPAVRNLGRLYAQTERWLDLIMINSEEAESISNQAHVVALLFRNGEIYADKLSDTGSAIACYQQALSLMPNYLPALKALGAMFGRAGRWQDLIEMHQQEAQVATSEVQRAQLLCDIAEIKADRLHDFEGAAAVYREVLDTLPAYHPAIRALAWISLKTGDFGGLAKVYREELAVLVEPRERSLLRCRIAELLERRLGRPEDAAEVLEEGIAEVADVLALHEQLVGLYGRRGDAESEAAARERMHNHLTDAESRCANLHVLGELYLNRLDASETALSTYGRLLEDKPDDMLAHRMAMRCALLVPDYAEAIVHGEALAELEPDATEVASLHLQVAAWKEGHLDPPEDSLQNYLSALQYEPGNPTALRSVERAYVERQEWHGLFRLYQMEMESAASTSQRVDLFVKMGDIAERKLEDFKLAIAQYESALAAQPSHLLATSRLKELYARMGRSEDQLRMLALEATVSKDPKRSIETLMEVGALQRDKFGSPESALQTYYKILEKQPLHPEASEAAEALLLELGRLEELAEFYVQRARHLTAQADQVALLQKAANLYEERLSNPAQACKMYGYILSIHPKHLGALTKAGALYFGLGQFDRSAKAYSRLVQLASGDAKAASAHYHLGIIYLEHLPDYAAAIHHLTACLSFAPDHRDAAVRLARAYVKAGTSGQALQQMQKLLERAADEDERTQLILALVDLYDRELNDPANAAAQMETLFSGLTDDAYPLEWIERAAGLYERAGNVDGYLLSARRFAERMAATEPAKAAEAWARSAQILFENKKDLDGALQNARKGLELAPDFTALRGFYADLLSRKPNQYAMAVEEHRKVLRNGLIRVPSLRALYQGWRTNRAKDRAFVAVELLEYLGAALDDERKFYKENARNLPEEAAERLSYSELLSWVVHPGQRNPVQEILLLVSAELSRMSNDDLEEFGDIPKQDILKAKNADPIRQVADSVASCLGGLSFDLMRTHAQEQVVAARRFNGSVLLVGNLVPFEFELREQRFVLGRKLTALRCGHQLLRGLDVVGFELLLDAIVRSVDKTHDVMHESSKLDALTKKVNGLLSRNTKKLLVDPVERFLSQRRQINLHSFMAACPYTEARGGLIVSAAVQPAMRTIAREQGVILPDNTDGLLKALENNPHFLDLVNYSLSDSYFMARQRLGVAVDA